MKDIILSLKKYESTIMCIILVVSVCLNGLQYIKHTKTAQNDLLRTVIAMREELSLVNQYLIAVKGGGPSYTEEMVNERMYLLHSGFNSVNLICRTNSNIDSEYSHLFSDIADTFVSNSVVWGWHTIALLDDGILSENEIQYIAELNDCVCNLYSDLAEQKPNILGGDRLVTNYGKVHTALDTFYNRFIDPETSPYLNIQSTGTLQ